MAENKYIYAVGRRKEASVRVRLFKGEGENMVNGKSVHKYFPGEIKKLLVMKPFDLTNMVGKYHFTAKVKGGGSEAQLSALVLGISRALVKTDKDGLRLVLKKAGFLTRDARIRERRKVNTGGKARRAKQSPKR